MWKIPWALWQSRNQKEHEKDYEAEIEQLHAEVHDQISLGYGGTRELEMLFRSEEIERVTSLRNPLYVRVWLRNKQAGRRRDQLRKGTTDDLGRMRVFMRNFLQK
jgi:hypothetical protein